MGFGLTNATKAVLVGAISITINTAILFGLPISDLQAGGLNAAIDAWLLVWLAFTFKDSPKRVESEAISTAAKEGNVEIIEPGE